MLGASVKDRLVPCDDDPDLVFEDSVLVVDEAYARRPCRDLR